MALADTGVLSFYWMAGARTAPNSRLGSFISHPLGIHVFLALHREALQKFTRPAISKTSNHLLRHYFTGTLFFCRHSNTLNWERWNTYSSVPPPIVQQLVKDLETYPGIRCEGRTDIQDVASTGGGCLLGAVRDRNPSFALVGDSHARMWVEAINAKAKSRERAGLGLAHSSCIPLVGITPPTRKECLEISESKIKFLENSTIRDVVLAGYWLEIAHTSQGVIDFQHSLEKTVERLKHANKRVFVMADVPELANDQAVQQLALKSLHEDGKLSYGLSIKQHLDKQGQINAVIASLAKKQNFIVLDPAQIICSTKGCLSAKEGETLYRDKHHLTDKGGIYFKNVFNPLFDIAPENTIYKRASAH